jgi:hypothetical protein
MCFSIFVSSNRDALIQVPRHGVNAQIAETFVGPHALADFDVGG